MFCGKCGQAMDGSTAFCPACGWRVPGSQAIRQEDSQAPWPLPQQDSERQADKGPQPVSEPPQPVADLFPETDPVPVMKQLPKLEPEPLPRVEPMRYPRPVERQSLVIPPRPAVSAVELPPDPPKKRGRGLTLALVLSLIVLVGVAGVFTYILIYRNSDGFKISQAEESILAGSYAAGLSEIEDVHTEAADAVREFADLLKQRDSFSALYRPGELQTSDDPAKICYDRLVLTFGGLRHTDALPEKLKKKYDTYRDRLTAMNNCLSAVSSDDLDSVQRGRLSFGKRKRGEEFTASEMEAVVGLTDHALRKLRSKLIENNSYKEAFSQSRAAAFRTMGELYTIASDQLEQDRYDLEYYQNNYPGVVIFQLDDIDRGYQADVGSLLMPVTTENDVKTNADTLYTALSYAWLAYAFDV